MNAIIEVAMALQTIADCLRQYDEIHNLPNCNDCNKVNECEYRPRWGATVRFNCPLWEAKPDKQKEAT